MYPKEFKTLKLENVAILFIELKEDNKTEIINNIGDYKFKIIKLIKRKGVDIVLITIEIRLDEKSCSEMIEFVTNIKNKIKTTRCKIAVRVNFNDIKVIKNTKKYISNYLETVYKMDIKGDNKEIDIKECVNNLNKYNDKTLVGITLDPSDETYFITQQCRQYRLTEAYKCVDRMHQKFSDIGGLLKTDMNYIWYDDNKQMDAGWCDKTDIEEECISDDDMYDDDPLHTKIRSHIDNLIKIQKLYGSEDNVNN